jgi:hypothetical protein
MADAQLEAGRLAARELAQRTMKCIISIGVLNAPCDAGETQSTHGWHAARLGDLERHLRPGQDAAVAGLGALRQLDLDHLDLRIARVGGEALLVERALGVAAAEVARADLPDQVAAVDAVVPADRPSPVSCAKLPRLAPALSARMALAGERAEAHRRDVEDARAVRLRARRPDQDAEVVRLQDDGCIEWLIHS